MKLAPLSIAVLGARSALSASVAARSLSIDDILKGANFGRVEGETILAPSDLDAGEAHAGNPSSGGPVYKTNNLAGAEVFSTKAIQGTTTPLTVPQHFYAPYQASRDKPYGGAYLSTIDTATNCKNGGSIILGIFWVLQPDDQLILQAFHQWGSEPAKALDLPISPGDKLTLLIHTLDSTAADLTIQNESKNQKASYNYVGRKETLCFASALFAIQDFGFGGAPIPFANFGQLSAVGILPRIIGDTFLNFNGSKTYHMWDNAKDHPVVWTAFPNVNQDLKFIYRGAVGPGQGAGS